MTIISCGSTKQDLEDGERVPARELYKSSVHTCKDRFGLNSHGYFIISAKYGLVHHESELPEYDLRLSERPDEEIEMWGKCAADSISKAVTDHNFDAVVIIAAKEYIEPIEPFFDTIDAAILTPWQTNDYVTGVGRGMSWCNDESNWPTNVDDLEEIGEIVG